MSKALRIGAMVIGGIALVATGVGAIGLAGAAGAVSVAGVSVGTLSAIATGLSLAAGLLQKKPSGSSFTGSQTEFTLDPSAGIPYAMGRTYTAGNIVHIDAYGAGDKPKNPYQSIVTVWSGGGPIQGYDSFLADFSPVAFTEDRNAVGYYYTYLHLSRQNGACPEANNLSSHFAGFPDWSGDRRLSGYAAGIWTARLDKNGTRFASGLPKLGVVLHGVLVYDPRQDSTYPGGSGPCRYGIESTYVGGAAAENPWCHFITFAAGRWQNGKRVMGVGLPKEGIDFAPIVEAANIADANEWKIGGVIDSTEDKFNVLKMIAQAGGGEVSWNGARLSCAISAPKVSVGTIGVDDLADGKITIPAMQSRRQRINGVIPRIRSESNQWQVVPLSVVRVADYVTVDGGERTKEVTFRLVQQPDQGAQLGAYEIMNARELGPITIPCKPHMLNYKAGDALTINLPDQGLNGRLCVIKKRRLDPASGIVELTLMSETSAKHSYAMTRTGSPPPTPSLKTPEENDAVAASTGAQAAKRLLTQTVSYPLTSDDDSVAVAAFDAVVSDGRLQSFTAATITGLASALTYAVFWDESAGLYSLTAAPATDLFADPDNIFIGWITTSAGGTYPDPDEPPPGSGGSGNIP